MIKGVHTMFYSSRAAETRKFLKEKLGFKATGTGQGWMIFDIPEADMGVHPAHGKEAPSGTHDISFYCDDIGKTVAQLKKKGVKFKGKIEDHGYGWVIYFKMPGNFWVQLYQPKYEK
jgi:catechol 2,3-dioxygenase-like lactoylglutathione lyase family enzyme